jgi:hypothetical protein
MRRAWLADHPGKTLADYERFEQAASCTGTKRIAEYLCGEREWTMQRISEALNTTHKTISKDLDEFVPKVQTHERHSKRGPKRGERAFLKWFNSWMAGDGAAVHARTFGR